MGQEPGRRTIAEQDLRDLGGRLSVLVRQKRDHHRLEELLSELDATTPAAQDAVLRRLYRLVFPHAFAEEAVLWPVLRRTLRDGAALTLRIEQEHQEVNELVTTLERLTPEDAERAATVARLAAVLREDARDEEDRLLPQLQAAVSANRLRALGLAWEAVRRVAPTRAHPVVARRPPGNVVAALPLSVLDRTRDAVDSAGHLRPGRVTAALDRIGRRLADAAHAVERLPGMRRGEDPSTSRG